MFVMRVEVGEAARAYVADHGGTVWVWVNVPRVRRCCTQGYMHAAVARPVVLSDFREIPADGLMVKVRGMIGHAPEVLRIDLAGRRADRLEAYWDGCRLAA
ncbi:MAG: hypothetical protein BGO26_13510 [Actinobacteria bacterium 69-20]|nr:hypothetical protein [Actinomycetota bacterium]OJV24310.1 MAG: hypothetical protein BGO26_13510 [Actinobacteria bacterium 69-20]